MKAEQILSVLMDDKKYKARVEELKALEAKVSNVQRIAATVEAAEQLVQAAKQREQDVVKRQLEIEQLLKQKEQALKEKYMAMEQELAKKASQDRAQWMDARKKHEEAVKLEIQTKAREAKLAGQDQALATWALRLQEQEKKLMERVKRVNEAFNG